MPNNVTNRIKSSKEVIDFLMDGDKVDFNKLIEMPQDLNLDGLHLNLEMLLIQDLNIPHKYYSETDLTYDVLSDNDKYIYNKAKQNYKKYGHLSWYTWSLENWGTKWNAYNVNRLSDCVVEFSTAWAGIPKLVQLLSEKFPSEEIHYSYADEGIDSNCGNFVYKNGVPID